MSALPTDWGRTMNISVRNKRELMLFSLLVLILCGTFFAIEDLPAIDYFFTPALPEIPNPGLEVDYQEIQDILEAKERRARILEIRIQKRQRLDELDFRWAPQASIGIVALAVYTGGTSVVYRHAKRNGRNVVRCVTASLLFSPILTGIVYLLTWPEGRSGDDHAL